MEWLKCCYVYLQTHQIASEGLKHRVFEVSLADLNKDEDQAYRKIRLRAEDVQGRNVLTQFWVRTLDSQHWFLALYSCWVLTFLSFTPRAWTSQPTNSGPWLRSGRLWSSLMSMLRPQTTTHWGFSASPSPRDVLTKLRELAMLSLARSVRYVQIFISVIFDLLFIVSLEFFFVWLHSSDS